MKLSDIIDRIEREKQAIAIDAMRNPSQKDLFEYGHAVGMYGGLDRAVQLVDEILGEEEDRRNRM